MCSSEAPADAYTLSTSPPAASVGCSRPTVQCGRPLSRCRRATDTHAAIRRHAPLHSAVHATLPHARAPQHFALLVGIERIHHARLLSGEKYFAAVVLFGENRRRAKVVVQPRAFVTRLTPAVEHVVGRGLARPCHAPHLQVHGYDSVGHLCRRVGKVVSGGGVQQSAFCVERRRAPHAGSRRSRVVPYFVRDVANSVGLPHL